MPDKRLALLMAAVFAVLAAVAIIFDWSFVIGRRGLDSATGEVAHYVGIFWFMLALITLGTMIPEPKLRRRVGSVLAIILALCMFGPLLYMLLAKQSA
jgi:hypothetical protein